MWLSSQENILCFVVVFADFNLSFFVSNQQSRNRRLVCLRRQRWRRQMSPSVSSMSGLDLVWVCFGRVWSGLVHFVGLLCLHLFALQTKRLVRKYSDIYASMFIRRGRPLWLNVSKLIDIILKCRYKLLIRNIYYFIINYEVDFK